MSKVEDVARYLRCLDKVVAALESAETSSVGIFLANPDTHGLPSMDNLHGDIRAMRVSVDNSVKIAERALKDCAHK